MNELAELRERLYELETRFRSVVQSAIDAIILADGDGNIISWNKGAQNIFGYEEGEVMGKPLTLLMPQRYREAHLKGLERVRSTGKSNYIGKISEMHGLRKDGSEFPLELSRTTWKVLDKAFYGGIIRDITERKRAEEELRKSEEKYRNLFNNSSDAIITIDLENRISSWNWSAERMFGWKAQEIKGKNLPELIVPSELKDEREKIIFDALSGKNITGIETTRLHKDGSRIEVSLTISPIKDSNQNIIGLSGILRDITEHKHMEEALRASEMKYRGIFENAIVGIFQTSLNGRVLAANPAITRMLGYESPEELMSDVTDFRKLLVEPGLRIQLMRTILTKGVVTDLEAQVSRKDGSKIWVLVSATAIRDSSGKITGLQGMWMDITDGKRAERNFQGLIESIPDAIVAIDPDFNILLVNAQTEKLFGYTRKEVLGKPFDILIPEHFIEEHSKYFTDNFVQNAIKTTALHFVTGAKRKDESEFQVEINMSPFETEEGMIIVTDIRETIRK